MPSVLARTPAPRMVTLPASTFIMGSTPGEMAVGVGMCRHEVLQAECDQVAQFIRSEGVAHEVYIDAFALDRREVSVGEYRRCVAAGACAAPGFSPRDPRFDRDELPVTQVRWGDAAAFCGWRGARLPTEAEWELAAKGPGGGAARLPAAGAVGSSPGAARTTRGSPITAPSRATRKTPPTGSPAWRRSARSPTGARPRASRISPATPPSGWPISTTSTTRDSRIRPARRSTRAAPRRASSTSCAAGRTATAEPGCAPPRGRRPPAQRSATIGFRCAMSVG